MSFNNDIVAFFRKLKNSSYDRHQFVVIVDDEYYPVKVISIAKNEYIVTRQDGTFIKIGSDWHLGDPMMLANIEGEEFAVHVRIVNVKLQLDCM